MPYTQPKHIRKVCLPWHLNRSRWIRRSIGCFIFLAMMPRLQAQEKKEYQVFVGTDTVKYYVLQEGKVEQQYSLDAAMTGYILIPSFNRNTNFQIVKSAAFRILARHQYINTYFFTNELAYREILYAKQMEIDPDEETVRRGFLCKVEGNVFKMSYFEW